MNQTDACTHVLTHIATELRDLCQQQAMSTEQAIRVMEQTLHNPTVRAWAALQVLRLAPPA